MNIFIENKTDFEWNERIGTININGLVRDTDKVHTRYVRIRPIEHHYENEGETPYIKYSCPICEVLGNKHQVPAGADNCMLCGIRLAWDHDFTKE